MELSLLDITAPKSKQFNKKGIYTIEDLVRFLPRKYNDLSVITGIIEDFDNASTVVKINDIKKYDSGTQIVIAFCTDLYSGERINVTWFNQPYIYNKIYQYRNSEVLVAGKMTFNEQYKNYSISNPLVFTPKVVDEAKIYPVYPKINGMSGEYLASKIEIALNIPQLKNDVLPEGVARRLNLMSTSQMLDELHSPSSLESLEQAQRRLIFDDLVYFSLRLQYAARKNSKGSQYGIKTLKYTNQAIKNLPYTLTNDQQSAVRNMCDCMRNGTRINALVQGDTGAGKSIVAFLMMLAMVDNGYQAALMAPTQVLARQHYSDLVELVSPYGIKVAFLGGEKISAKEKRAILQQIENNEIQIVVGTHAILNKDVRFANLALTVTDEEHKFGVMQRKALVEKAAMGVHSITMSATPIPRSLAQVVYGEEIQLHTIKTLPNGRKPIATCIHNNIKDTFSLLTKEIQKGHQIYVVCPMIDKNENLDGVKSVEETYEVYRDYFSQLGVKVCSLTGKNSKEETDDIISRFKNREYQILIATTVIEVGVNVPNATAIVIHNAERFGLSGLHQLRGRVGRGQWQSYCILFSEDVNNERLNVMTSTTDGFKIAEEDLRIRGTGDFIGTRQSGDNKYIALMLSYPDDYQIAKSVASDLLDTEEECIMMTSLFVEHE